MALYRATLAWDAQQTTARNETEAREIFDVMLCDGELATGWPDGAYELWQMKNGEWERVEA